MNSQAQSESGSLFTALISENSQIPQNVTEKSTFQTHVVLMKGITWARDSHGLFDYESRHLTKKTMKTNNHSMIFRKENDIEMITNQQVTGLKQSSEDQRPLLVISNENDQFYLESMNSSHATDKYSLAIKKEDPNATKSAIHEDMYLVVRSLKHNNNKIDYQLQKGDIIKIGRIKFCIKEICIEEENLMEIDQEGSTNMKDENHHLNVQEVKDDEFFEFQEVESIQNPDSTVSTTHITPSDSELHTCKFCWESKTEQDNPLIMICQCSGSVKFIHYNCLKSWLDSKKQMKQSDTFTTIYWKAFECELCKTAYPLMIKTQGVNYTLVGYDKPKGNYLVLESLNQEKNTKRIVHIIKPNAQKDTFKLGRGHESDLRIDDISVSRCHALIKFKNGKFSLEDNLSKFGTLVLVKKRTPLLSNFNKAVQIGRTVINFSVKNISYHKQQQQEGGLIDCTTNLKLPQDIFAKLQAEKSKISQMKDSMEDDLNVDENVQVQIDPSSIKKQ